MPDFVGADDLPLQGVKSSGDCYTISRETGEGNAQLAEAEQLQRMCVEWYRRNAASLLTRPSESLSDGEKNMLRTLAVSIAQLGNILLEQGKPEIVESSLEAITIYQKIGDKASEAVRAYNLGHAYKDLPALRNLDEAERWYRRSLELL